MKDLILMVDTSGSMTLNHRFEAVNTAMERLSTEVFDSLTAETRNALRIRVLGFSGNDNDPRGVRWLIGDRDGGVSAASFSWQPPLAQSDCAGGTPTGKAIKTVTECYLANGEPIRGGHAPGILLISDGESNGEASGGLAFTKALNDAINTCPHFARATRLAIGINPQSPKEEEELKAFCNDPVKLLDTPYITINDDFNQIVTVILHMTKTLSQ